MQTLIKEINQRGLKATRQRALILDVIRNSPGHVDADDVYRRVAKKNPRISLSTVYRALQKFKEIGIIEQLHFSEEHHHYEMKPKVEHYHLVCLDCGAVIEFPYPLVEIVSEKVPAASGFKITGSDVTLTGYCRKCARKRKGKEI